MTHQLNICHLYPDLMDTYGDKGNIITLVQRCKWRGIEVTVTNIGLNETLSTNDFDLFFFGGGQDRQQVIVGQDLQKKADDLKKTIEEGSVLLSICGGYQLLQNYFKTLDGTMIKGVGLFDAHTIGSTNRMIQNILIEINPVLQNEISRFYPLTINHKPLTNLVGFENHSGKTYIGKGVKPLGKVIIGAGNNGEDQTEGTVYKNAYGCYLHGSLLPKNPHFADYLIAKALERRYGTIKLEPLDDTIEWQTNQKIVSRIKKAKILILDKCSKYK